MISPCVFALVRQKGPAGGAREYECTEDGLKVTENSSRGGLGAGRSKGPHWRNARADDIRGAALKVVDWLNVPPLL